MAEADKKLWYLSQINLFRDLSEDVLQDIVRASQMRSFEKGFYISTPHDDTEERLYFLKEGEVEIYESTEGGKKMIINILKPGDIFGYANIGSTDLPKQFIKANKDAVVCIMPKKDFLALLERKPELALRVIKNSRFSFPPRKAGFATPRFLTWKQGCCMNSNGLRTPKNLPENSPTKNSPS